MKAATTLHDVRVPTRYKLAAIWASVMSCFIYADYFELYVPGKLQGMLAGRMEPLGPVTQGVLLGTSAMLAVPSLMIALSVLLPPGPCRWLNLVVGLLYAVLQLLVISHSGWAFYIGFGLLEVALMAFVVWTAWRWPTVVGQAAGGEVLVAAA
ncbi:DUF6326 family protein [Cognatilysobacter lacus]|uniref:Uncharacterized protein n=1 Tax=Cognatilysobacter lacus TaxID=1643323 RepID=A0A5D8Z501_9GAMM|nr:DUF6326 family protein [Lysobacter lacus]TZF87774.1 hypothetical protein FW784_10645 [Lysobacter lacus]